MTDPIPGGHFLMSRMIYHSAIWERPPQYLRLWTWIIGKAAFQDGHTFKGHVLKRGELITTHGEIMDALSYRFNRAIKIPTLKEIRNMLSWLQSEGMILMKPLIDGTLPNRGRDRDRTRAYVGTLISVVNYITYQDSESYKGRDKGRHRAEQGQTPKECREECIKSFSSDSIEIRLSELLLKKILSRNPGFKSPNIQTWAKETDLMLRVDHRTPEDIRRVIEWCQADPFWQNNILSVTKLRKKFDQLQMKMGTSGGKATPVDTPAPLKCSLCGRHIVTESDLLTGGGCVYCHR
jgi:hypothetical protein